MLYSRFSRSIFIHSSVYMSIPVCQFIPASYVCLLNKHSLSADSGLTVRAYSSYGWKFVHFDQHFPTPPTLPAPRNHHSTLCFCESSFFSFHIEVRIYGISLSLSDLFHFAEPPQGPFRLLQKAGFLSF